MNKYLLSKYNLLGSRQFLLSLTTVKFVKIYVYAYMYITTVMKKEIKDMNKNKEGAVERFGGRKGRGEVI